MRTTTLPTWLLALLLATMVGLVAVVAFLLGRNTAPARPVTAVERAVSVPEDAADAGSAEPADREAIAACFGSGQGSGRP